MRSPRWHVQRRLRRRFLGAGVSALGQITTVVGPTVSLIPETSLAAALVGLNGPSLAGLSGRRSAALEALRCAGLGEQLGPMVSRRLRVRTLRWCVAATLLPVGALMLVRSAALRVFTR